MRGTVEWFSNAKGYGFIQPDDISIKRVYVHHTAIVSDGFRTLNKGERVTFDTVKGPHGVQAKNVLRGISDEPKSSDELGSSEDNESEFVAIGLVGDSLKLLALSTDGSCRFLDEVQRLHNILYVFDSEALALGIAVDQLETMINDPRTKEADLQDFFERNPDFITNDDYKKAHAHLVLESEEEGGALIPDFVLEPIGNNPLCDILELKLPSVSPFILKQRRMRYSAAVLEACAQLRQYSHFFEDAKNRRLVKERYGLSAYRPRMFVVIGRRGNLDPISIRLIQSDTPSLLFRTYDDVVERMKHKIGEMRRRRTSPLVPPLPTRISSRERSQAASERMPIPFEPPSAPRRAAPNFEPTKDITPVRGNIRSYGLHRQLTTRPGNRDAVVAILLHGLKDLKAAGCTLYLVGISESQPDIVCLTEVWVSKEAHDASRNLSIVNQSFAEVRPLLTGDFTTIELSVVGGLGVPKPRRISLPE
jgi:cold shock CspA family protein/quinol monooxygenase YgiN